MTTLPHFSAQALKRSDLLFPLTAEKLQILAVTLSNGEILRLTGLKPQAEKDFIKRFIDNQGAVVIEGLKQPGLFRTDRDMRCFNLGLAVQMSQNPDLLAACGRGRTDPFRLRVVGDPNRTKRKVRHVDEIHYDCGPQDDHGCSDNKDVHALLIGDGPYRGVLPGQKTRLLASSKAYPGTSYEAPTVHPRAGFPREELDLYTEFNPHLGLIFLTSNVDSECTAMSRWTHVIKPDRFAQPFAKPGLELSAEFVQSALQLGYSQKQLNHFVQAIQREKQRLEEAWEQQRQTLEVAVRAAIRTRTQAMQADLGDLREETLAAAQQLQSVGKTAQGTIPGLSRLRRLTPGMSSYQSRLHNKLTALLKRETWGKNTRSQHPYALFQLTNHRQSTPKDYWEYVNTGNTS